MAINVGTGTGTGTVVSALVVGVESDVATMGAGDGWSSTRALSSAPQAATAQTVLTTAMRLNEFFIFGSAGARGQIELNV